MNERDYTKMTKEPHDMILRSVFMTPEMDAFLRQKAFDLNVSKSQLIRSYIQNDIDGSRSEMERDRLRDPARHAEMDDVTSKRPI